MTANVTRIITSDDKVASTRLRKVYNLKKAELGLTQVKLAEKTGWTQGFISHCMTARVSMPMPVLIKWATILGVEVHEIDPNFSKRFPRIQKAQIPIKDTSAKVVGMTERVLAAEEYAIQLDINFGVIPKKTIVHINPQKIAAVGQLTVCRFIDTQQMIFGVLTQIQKTQIKLDTDHGIVVVPFNDLEYYHPIIRFDLP